MGVIQPNLPTLLLSKIAVFGRSNSNRFEAPDSLNGCGSEKAKGFFTCTGALIMEVRPAVILEFQL